MSRKNEILALIAKGNYTDALFAELKQIDAAEEKAKAERQTQIASAIKGLVVAGVTFSELMDAQIEGQPVFKAGELIAYAQNKGIKVTKAAGATGATGTRTKQDHGITLFVLPKVTVKGAASTIGTKTKRINVTESQKALAKSGDLKANLLACAVKTPEAQQFLATAQGQALVDAWVNFIKAKA